MTFYSYLAAGCLIALFTVFLQHLKEVAKEKRDRDIANGIEPSPIVNPGWIPLATSIVVAALFTWALYPLLTSPRPLTRLDAFAIAFVTGSGWHFFGSMMAARNQRKGIESEADDLRALLAKAQALNAKYDAMDTRSITPPATQDKQDGSAR